MQFRTQRFLGNLRVPVYARIFPEAILKGMKSGGRVRRFRLSKKYFDSLSKFSERFNVLKTYDFNGAGNPGRVSRTHPSFPPV